MYFSFNNLIGEASNLQSDLESDTLLAFFINLSSAYFALSH